MEDPKTCFEGAFICLVPGLSIFNIKRRTSNADDWQPPIEGARRSKHKRAPQLAASVGIESLVGRRGGGNGRGMRRSPVSDTSSL